MRCPICGGKAELTTPDYDYGYGAGFRCYAHGEYSFSSKSDEAMEESKNSLAQSKANAEAYRPTRDKAKP